MRVTSSRPRLRIRSTATPLASRAVVLVITSAIVAGFVPASADPVVPEVGFVDEFAEAKSTGEPVEIVDERTPTDTTYANPSGTYTLEASTAPIRVETRDGWEPVDLTLVEKDGVLVPRMAAGLIRFSAGGSDPMVEIGHGSATTAVQWPGVLPEPMVDGPTATYEDVFDGVDLKLSVTDVGVSQVLVVHDAQAAANPDLEELQLATDVDGGSIMAKDGGYLVLDDTGREVGMSPQPMMWDSSGTLLDADHDVIADPTAEAVEQRIQGPTQGDEISDIDLTVDDDALVLAPDEEALVGEDVSYPVYIDPVATSSSPSNWSMVFKQNPNSTFFKWTDSAGQGVGYQNYEGVSTKRLFYEHGISSVRYTKIKRATFKARMNWSASCTTRPIRVYRVAAPVSGRTWNNQPDFLELQDTKSYSAGWSGCNPSGRDVVWDVKSAVTDAAAAGRPTVSFGMRAVDEGDPLTWRRFRHTTVLSVEYNRPPSAPTSLKVAGKLCTSSGVVLKRMTSPPVMSAVMKDPDGGNVRGWFQWAKRSSITSSDPEITPEDSVKSGSPVSISIPGSLVNGTFPSGTWTFRVRGSDSSIDYGPYSGQCKFTVDSTLAPVPQVKNYPGESDPDERWPADVSQPVQFWPADGQAADTAGYAYTIDNDQAPAVKDPDLALSSTDKSAPAVLPAKSAGVHVLRVWAFDAAGNRSQDPDVLEFEAVSGSSTARSTYQFEGDSGQAAGADSTGGMPMSIGTATRTNRVLLTDGVDILDRDRMLQVGASTAELPSLTGDAVALSNSYSIAAFLDPGALDSPTAMTAVTVRGANGTELAELGVEPDGEGFAYVFKVWDTTSQSWRQVALGGEDADTGTTLVVANFDLLNSKLSLTAPDRGKRFMSEDFIGTAVSSLPGQQLVLGADSAGSSRWMGSIDNLVIGRGSLTSSEISDLQGFHDAQPECHSIEGGCQ